MTKAKVEFTTAAGVVPAGSILSDKELKEHFSDDEIEDFKSSKYLEVINVPEIEILSTTSKKEEEGVEIKHIDEMEDSELEAYAQELGIDTSSHENSNETYNSIVEFDYSTLKVTPIKKFAQIIDVSLEGATKKDEYIAFLDKALEEIKIDNSGKEEE